MNPKKAFPVPLLPLLPVVLAAATGPALAAERFVGLGLGQSDYRIETTGASSADTRDRAAKVYGGVMFGPHLGVELSLFDLGESRGLLALPGAGSVTATARVRGAGGFAVGALPLGSFTLFGKLGGTYARAETKASGGFGSLEEKESSFQPAGGLGATYSLTPQLGLRAEYERMRVKFAGGEKDDVDLMTLGVTYRF